SSLSRPVGARRRRRDHSRAEETWSNHLARMGPHRSRPGNGRANQGGRLMQLTNELAAALEAARLEGRITEGKRVQLPDAAPETEKDFMARVIALAKSRGYKVYHTLNSRGSEAGLPDLVLAPA